MTAPLAQWRPQLKVFIRRCLWVGGATLVVFILAGVATGYWQILYAAPVLIAAYTFLFDDHLRWRAVRQDRWELTPTTLIHHGFEGEAQIPLADVADTATHFGWTVIVMLKSGLRVEIAYVRNPRDIAARILAARNAMAEADDDAAATDRKGQP